MLVNRGLRVYQTFSTSDLMIWQILLVSEYWYHKFRDYFFIKSQPFVINLSVKSIKK